MKLKRKSVLWSWFGSYLVILCIPLIAIFINYLVNSNTIRNELVRVREMGFVNLTDGIDNYLNQLKANYTYVFQNDSFEQLKNRRYMNRQFYSNTKELQDQLYAYPNRKEEMFCMIYISDKDYLVSNEQSCLAGVFYGSFKYKFSGFIEYEEWKAMLSAQYADTYMIAKGLNFWSQEDCLVYVNTIKGRGSEYYNVFVSVPLSNIKNLSEYGDEEFDMLINIDEEKYLYNKSMIADSNLSEEPADNAVHFSKNSKVSGLSYDLFIDKENINRELAGVRSSFWVSLSIVLLLAMLGIVILILLNYQPVYAIINEMEEEFEAEESGEQNEFDRLKSGYLKLKNEKKTTQELIDMQNRELLNARLLTMMKGRFLMTDGSENLEKLGLELKSRILLSGFMFKVEKSDSEYDELPYFIVDNVFSELMEGEHMYRVEDGSFLYYLFEVSSDTEEEWRQNVASKMEYVCDLLNDKGSIVTGVLGEIGESVSMLRNLYGNLMDAFEYSKLLGGQNFMDVRSMPDYDEFYLVRDYREESLREAFAEKSVEAACGVLDKIFTSGKAAGNIAIIKIHAYETFNMVMDIFREYVSDVSQQETAIGYLHNLSKAQSGEEIRGYFKELLQFQIQTIARQQIQENKGIVSKVIKYVDENYSDYNLNLSSMAEGLKRNSRYISRVFKEETQMGILDYINTVRINKARELMAERKYTLEELAAMVGYNNVRSFRRAFVKIMGEMPSTYMEN